MGTNENRILHKKQINRVVHSYFTTLNILFFEVGKFETTEKD